MVRKKSGLIVFVILLGSLADADILRAQSPYPFSMFQIGTRYLDGTAFDPQADILQLDENLYLSVYTEEPFFTGSANYYWKLICNPSLATIAGGVFGPDAPTGGHIYDIPDGRAGWYVDLYPAAYPGLYLDEFIYTPQSVGDVTVELWGTCGHLDGVMELEDSIVINQVPEPMTISLLGFGVLLLHRSREKR